MSDLSYLSNNIGAFSNGIWSVRGEEDISYTKNGHFHIRQVESKSFWFEHRINCLKTAMRNYPLQGPVLDVGGGNGSFSMILQSMGLETILLEPGMEGAINAHKAGVKHIVNGTLQKTDFKKESFTTIVMLDVLEHIDRDAQFMLEIQRVMKPGGRLLLTVPALQILYSPFDEEVGHFRRYSLTRLSRLLRRSGFEVEYQTYFFSMLVFPIFLYRKLWDRKRKEERPNLKGHYGQNSLIGWFLKPFQFIESFLIRSKLSIPIGTSCLVVARKSPVR